MCQTDATRLPSQRLTQLLGFVRAAGAVRPIFHVTIPQPLQPRQPHMMLTGLISARVLHSSRSSLVCVVCDVVVVVVAAVRDTLMGPPFILIVPNRAHSFRSGPRERVIIINHTAAATNRCRLQKLCHTLRSANVRLSLSHRKDYTRSPCRVSHVGR